MRGPKRKFDVKINGRNDLDLKGMTQVNGIYTVEVEAGQDNDDTEKRRLSLKGSIYRFGKNGGKDVSIRDTSPTVLTVIVADKQVSAPVAEVHDVN